MEEFKLEWQKSHVRADLSFSLFLSFTLLFSYTRLPAKQTRPYYPVIVKGVYACESPVRSRSGACNRKERILSHGQRGTTYGDEVYLEIEREDCENVVLESIYTSPETNWGWPSRSRVSCGITFGEGWNVDPWKPIADSYN